MRARCVLAVSVALALQLLAVSADAKEVNQAENFAAYQKLVGPGSSHVTARWVRRTSAHAAAAG